VTIINQRQEGVIKTFDITVYKNSFSARKRHYISQNLISLIMPGSVYVYKADTSQGRFLKRAPQKRQAYCGFWKTIFKRYLSEMLSPCE